MSAFYDQASLVVVPSGYKTSKVYAQKPLTTDGQLSFSRASAATRVNSAGLIERVRTNLVLQSETFGNASWGKSLVTITDNFDTAPNGTLTADRFVSAGGAFPQIAQAITVVSGTQYTASLYVKSDGTTQIAQVIIIGGNTVSFTPTNAWQRITTTFTAASSSATFVLATNSAAAPASSFVIWGAQLETGDIATQYIATTTAAVSVGPVANVPRLDYLNSSCPKLILEGQRTNVALFSEQFNSSSWIKSGSGVGIAPVVTANNGISPDGYQNADRIDLNLNGGTSFSDWSWVYQSFSATGTQPQAFSIYLKAATAGDVGKVIRVGFISYVTHTLTADWTRVVLNQTFATTSTFYIGFRLRGGEATANTASLYAWGAQLEQNAAYSSSYIPTTTAAVTRLADACSKTGISSLIGQTEGTLFAEFDFNGNYDANGIVAMDVLGAGNNEAYIFITGAGLIRLELYVAGAIQCSITSSIGAVGRKKIAFAYKANDFVGYMNGVQLGTDTSGTVGAMNTIYVGTYQAPTYATGNINQALLFKTRLTNAQLAELTTL